MFEFGGPDHQRPDGGPQRLSASREPQSGAAEMRVTLGTAVTLLLLGLPAAAEPHASRASTIADSAGTIVGQARSCGVDQRRLQQIGEKVSAAIARTATSGADQRSAADLYSTAIIVGERRQAENASGQSCPAVLRSFEGMLSRE
jgi:hypothetical protein